MSTEAEKREANRLRSDAGLDEQMAKQSGKSPPGPTRLLVEEKERREEERRRQYGDQESSHH